jgi:hypothetical protein
MGDARPPQSKNGGGGRHFFPAHQVVDVGHLYDGELRRRINARRHRTIGARLVGVAPSIAHRTYRVTGDVTFHGRVLTFEHDMAIRFDRDDVILSGEDVFDIRQFGMEPPSMLMIRVYPEISVRLELLGLKERT